MQASLDLQRALVAALGADGVLAALGLTAWDGPPADARAPYLSVGADVVSDRGWKGGVALEHRFSVSLWDAREGVARVKAGLAEVERVVLAMPRDIGGMRLATLAMVRAQVKRNPKGLTQGVLEFRALSVRED